MPNKPLVFVADDEKVVIDSVRSVLEPAYEVHSSTLYSDAIETLREVRIRAKKDSDRYAVVIIDLEFVQVKKVHSDAGIKILEEAIKDEYAEPIIFTGHGTEELAAAASKLGMFRYIKKYDHGVETGMDTVREAVDFACMHRKNIIALRESIEDFHRKMVLLHQTDKISKAQFTQLVEMHKKANQVFDGMLRYRGRRFVR